MATYQDDYRNQDNQGTGDDQLGENTEQTPLANAVTNDRHMAEEKGWENNKPGVTTENENDHHIPTVTPDNDNGIAGPFDFIDDDHIKGAMRPQDAGYSPDEDGTDDDDLVDDDDDLLDDDDEEELIPIETDDDDDDLDLDDDDDLDEEEDSDLDPLADRPTTFESDGDFATRDHGRVTGTMIDHEPGLPGSSDKRDYNL
ncbi:MAG: hypothetical protein K0S09_2404 [Sphingobacteriaceae bacterium]|jgi:hypothetical protein|nr:hypothetical protein [Sphingobacteriaceae bacterium]